MAFWDSELFKKIERTGELPTVKTEFGWEEKNLVDTLVGIFILCICVTVAGILLRKYLG